MFWTKTGLAWPVAPPQAPETLEAEALAHIDVSAFAVPSLHVSAAAAAAAKKKLATSRKRCGYCGLCKDVLRDYIGHINIYREFSTPWSSLSMAVCMVAMSSWMSCAFRATCVKTAKSLKSSCGPSFSNMSRAGGCNSYWGVWSAANHRTQTQRLCRRACAERLKVCASSSRTTEESSRSSPATLNRTRGRTLKSACWNFRGPRPSHRPIQTTGEGEQKQQAESSQADSQDDESKQARRGSANGQASVGTCEQARERAKSVRASRRGGRQASAAANRPTSQQSEVP